MEAVGEMQAVDDKTFTISLKTPFPLILDALGKLSSNVPFMMPERLAKTDAYQQIPEAIGSGPFKFVKEEWVPGSKAVFVKNPDYVPREEPPSFAAGGKVAKVDRVEWLYIPDTATASAALNAGEADWYEQPPADLVPVFAANKDIVVTTVDPLGNHGILRFNHIQPPFDNPKMREAVLNLVDQKEYMGAAAGDPKYWKTCVALFGCGTPLATDAGADELLNGPNLAKAKAADRGGRLQGREDRAARRDRPADRARPGAGDIGRAEQGRAQCRTAGQRLGHLDHPPRLEGAGRQGRLEHVPHLDLGSRLAVAGGQHRWSAAMATRRGSAGRTTRRSRR